MSAGPGLCQDTTGSPGAARPYQTDPDHSKTRLLVDFPPQAGSDALARFEMATHRRPPRPDTAPMQQDPALLVAQDNGDPRRDDQIQW